MNRKLLGLVVVSAAAVGLTLAGLAFLGWFTAERPWPVATGWDRIPVADRPAGARSILPAVSREGDGGDEPRLSWLGHAGFVLRWQGRTILFDPNLDGHCTVAHRVLQRTITPEELGPIDAVLISHAHYDHLDLPTLRRLRRIALLVVPPGAATYVSGPEWSDVPETELAPGERLRLGGLEVIAVPAAHNGDRLHPFDSSAHLAIGYIVRSKTRTIYYSGDTGVSLDFGAIGREFRPDVAILPIGAFLPRVPLSRYHLSPEEAVEAARRLGVDLVVPSHFGTFRLSLDAPDLALPRFARAARRAGLRWMMPSPASASRLERRVAPVTVARTRRPR